MISSNYIITSRIITNVTSTTIISTITIIITTTNLIAFSIQLFLSRLLMLLWIVD